MKKFLLAVFLVASSAFAVAPANTVPDVNFAFRLDHYFSNETAAKESLGTKLYRAHNTAYGILDCSKQVCAPGDLKVGIQLPAKAILRQVFFDTVIGITPGSTSIAWKLKAANDILTAQTENVWTTGNLTPGIQTGAAANFIKINAASDITATLTTSTATAGKIRVFADYVVSE